MKISLKNFGAFLFALLFMFEAQAAPKIKMELQPDGLYLGNLNVVVMKKIFEDYGYKSYVREDRKIPPLMVERLPDGYAGVKPKDERNRLFIMILAPLALKVNEELIFERQELLALKEAFDSDSGLNKEQQDRLEALAVKYDVFTRMENRERQDILLRALTEKIDEIPPSLLIAAAAAESNWGTAAEVKEGNALYKLKDWYTDKGIKPAGEDDDSYRIRVYPDLIAAVRDYALKMNSDVNYQHFRIARRQMRTRNQVLKGRTTVYNMVIGSPLENYAGLLSYILTFYDLVNIDESRLDSVNIAGKK